MPFSLEATNDQGVGGWLYVSHLGGLLVARCWILPSDRRPGAIDATLAKAEEDAPKPA